MEETDRDRVNNHRRALMSSAFAIGAASWSGLAEAAEAPGSTRALSTIAELRAASAEIETTSAIALVYGAAAPGDGGGGLFVLDRREASARDDNATLIVDKAGNRWRRRIEDDRIDVKWFGAVGDGAADDTRALQAAVDFIGEREGAAVFLPYGVYRITDAIRVGGKHFRCIGNDAKIVNGNARYAAIAGPTEPHTAPPTAGDPGPMRGCAFYFTSLIYYSSLERVTLSGFRFALAWLVPHNSPILRECSFESCNVAMFCYSGSQNHQVLNCNADDCSVVWVSSATCFAADSPYAAQDNYYTDGLRIANASGYGSFGRLTVNHHFDDWFIRSLLRPEIPSVSAAGRSTYVDFEDKPYPASHDYCRPSGRLLFIPFRNLRSCFGLTLENIDMRSGAPRGVGLVNTSVFDFVLRHAAIEGMWDRSTRNETGPALQLGAALSGHIAGVSPRFWSLDTSDTHPAIGWTHRGGYPGAGARLLAHLGTDLKPAPHQRYLGFIRGVVHRRDENIFVAENNPEGRDLSDTRVGAAISHYFDFQTGARYTDHVSELIADGIPFIGHIPLFDGKSWRADINFILTNALAGALELSVLNLSEGAWDHGEFYVEAAPKAEESFVLQAPVENGSRFVAIDAKPSTTARFTRFSLQGGGEVVLDSFDDAQNLIHPVGGVVSGLAAAVPAGARISRANVCNALLPFRRGWIDIGFGLSVYAGAATLCVRNNLAAAPSQRADSLFLVVKYKSAPGTAEKQLASGPPTAGLWARNAIVWNDRCEAGGSVGWVCVEAGRPGRWKSFGPIAT